MTHTAFKHLLPLLLACLWCSPTWSAEEVDVDNIFHRRAFVNQSIDIDHFEIFFEDHIGRIWGGSYNNGVMAYNGETFVRKITGRYGKRGIHCCEYIEGDNYLVGCNPGLFVFNIRTLDFEPIANLEDDIVKGIERIDDKTFICFCEKKIVKYDIRQRKAEIISQWNDIRLVKQVKYDHGRYFIITDFFGIFTFDYKKLQLSKYDINGLPYRKEMLLDMILFNGNLWIGSDHKLYCYDIKGRKLSIEPVLDGKTIKVLYKDNFNGIWAGTNNGLFRLDPNTKQWSHYKHSTKEPGSILNDCVWCVCQDKRGNIWIGVDGGISFIPSERKSLLVNWNWNSDSDLGNRVNHIYRDTKKNYWFGGINGLSYHHINTGQTKLFNTFCENPIPDNTVRCFYEDSEGVMWIGTDRGLSYYDNKSHRFINCLVVDPASERNSVWTYGITQDSQGRFWLATCSGGVFCVDRKDLLLGGTVPALCNYSPLSKSHPLSDGSCMGIVKTDDGHLWVRASHHVYRFNAATLMDSSFPKTTDDFPVHSEGVFEKDGNQVYISRGNNIVRLSDKDSDTIDVRKIVESSGSIISLAISKDYLWLLTSQGVFSIDKANKQIRSIMDLSAAQYKCIYYDSIQNQIWLGGIDHCLVFDPIEGLSHQEQIDAQSLLSEIYVNNVPLSPLIEINGRKVMDQDAAFCQRLFLNTDENNLGFRFSTGAIYRGTEFHTGYYYRMKELNPNWTPIRSDNPLIEYSYLKYGNYHLEIGIENSDTKTITPLRSILIQIKAPWYLSWWFQTLISLAVIVMALAIINHYRLRSKYKIAEIDRQKTAALSEMKMDFITDMSHELKTPLTLILGSVNKLLSTVKSSPTRTEIQSVEKNIRKMSSVISHIINYREEAEQPEQLITTKIEASEFVRSVVSTFSEVCSGKQIHLDFIAADEKVYVEIDPIKMESVINNLLSNAYKFTPPEGNIAVCISTVDSFMRLEVKDTGSGIPEKDLPQIFSRFFQSEYNQKENATGSGIGLYMVKNYVEKMGGTISVVSVVGQGSTFMVSLPLAENITEIQPKMLNDTTSLGIKVLIVEDNLEIAQYLANGLKGMDCTIAHNGKSGMEKALELMPDIIIADIMMPIMNGEEMCRQLKRNLQTCHIPIIMLTAKDDKKTEHDAYKMGVNAFISKPFDIQQLIVRVSQLVNEKKRYSALSQENETLVSSPLPAVDDTDADRRFLDEVTKAIDENLDDSELNVKRLAELTGINERQMYRRIKMLTGTTAVDYIKLIRMKKAALLLSQKKFTVKEVMYMVGFVSHSYFAKCFMEKYGQSPTDFMRNAAT